MKKFLLISTVIFPLLFNSCTKEVSTSVEEPLLKKNGLFIESKPSGAKIYINGKNTGQFTPDTIYWLNPGNVDLLLKLNLFKDSTVIAKVDEGVINNIYLDYTVNKSMVGHLYIDSNPRGAKIFLNDSSLNQVTPYKVTNLVPGLYRVKFSKPDYWDEERIIPVKSVVTTYLDHQMTDSILWVNMNTNRTKIPTNYLTSVAVQKGYIKWIGTLDKGLIRYDDSEWKLYDMSNSILPDDKINSVYVDRANVVWVCTDFGLVKIDGENWTLYNSGNSGLADHRISSVYNDDTKIWIGTYSKGVITFDGTTWTQLNRENWYLPSNRVTCISQNWNSIWVGTDNGLLKVTKLATGGTTYRVYTSANSAVPSSKIKCGFPTDNISALALDINGKAWVGCAMDFNGNTGGTGYERSIYFRCFRGLPSDDVFSIAVDANNIKWVGSSANGLSRCYNDKYTEKWTHYNIYNSAIGSDRIHSIAIDGAGHKWLASFDGGLIKYKGN